VKAAPVILQQQEENALIGHFLHSLKP